MENNRKLSAQKGALMDQGWGHFVLKINTPGTADFHLCII